MELESFLLRKQGATWDNLPLPAFTIRDVDDDVIKRFKKWAANDPETWQLGAFTKIGFLKAILNFSIRMRSTDPCLTKLIELLKLSI